MAGLIYDQRAQSEEMEFDRGRTRSGQTGWVAWMDGPTRQIHVQEAKCLQAFDGMAEVKTADGEFILEVPFGRLDATPDKALDALAFDLRAESEKAMKPIQERLGAIARTLLLDLVAVEMAKKKSGGNSDRDNLEDGIKRIGHNG